MTFFAINHDFCSSLTYVKNPPLVFCCDTINNSWFSLLLFRVKSSIFLLFDLVGNSVMGHCLSVKNMGLSM